MFDSEQKIDFKITKGPSNYLRLAILILLTLAIVLLVYFFFFREKPMSPFQSLPQKGILLELLSSQTEYQTGDLVNVKLSLYNRTEKSQGVDILIKYDPQFLALLTIDGKKEDFSKNTGAIKVDSLKYLNTQGTIFDTFPYFTINEKSGLIGFSAIAKPLEEISGADLLIGSLNFKALTKGETSLSIVFEKGKTNESNVASFGKDVLSDVKNLNIIIY